VDGVVGRGVERVVEHDLQHEVDAPAQVEAEVDLARLAVVVDRGPDGDAAGDERGAVEHGPEAQLRAQEGVDDASERRGEQQPERDRVLQGGGHHFSVFSVPLACSPATALFRTLILVFSSTRTWKASSSVPTIVPKMPELSTTLSPLFRLFTRS